MKQDEGQQQAPAFWGAAPPNVPPEVFRAVCHDGKFDGALYVRLHDELDYDDLLDVIEMREAAADARLAAELDLEARRRDERAMRQGAT